MWLLGRRLRRAGRAVHALDYPSTRQSLAENCAFVHQQIVQLRLNGPIDLVGHSMGGVIARRLCLEHAEPDIHRVVQIGSPNLGSALANNLGPFWAVRKACGPSVNDLRVVPGPLQRDARIAAIASTGGCQTRNGILRGPHDGAVTVRSAWAGSAKQYRTRTMHTLMPLSKDVAKHVVDALRLPALHVHSPTSSA